MNQTAILVDIYCRSASDEPKTQTKLDEQEAACRAYCQEQGLTVAMVHREVASGSTYRDRKQLSLMRQRYLKGSIQGMVVTELSLLSPSLIHRLILLDEMVEHRVKLYCTDESGDSQLKVMRSLLEFAAELEREKALSALPPDPPPEKEQPEGEG